MKTFETEDGKQVKQKNS